MLLCLSDKKRKQIILQHLFYSIKFGLCFRVWLPPGLNIKIKQTGIFSCGKYYSSKSAKLAARSWLFFKPSCSVFCFRLSENNTTVKSYYRYTVPCISNMGQNSKKKSTHQFSLICWVIFNLSLIKKTIKQNHTCSKASLLEVPMGYAEHDATSTMLQKSQCSEFHFQVVTLRYPLSGGVYFQKKKAFSSYVCITAQWNSFLCIS